MANKTKKKLSAQARLDLAKQLVKMWKDRIHTIDSGKQQCWSNPAGTIHTCRLELMEALGIEEEK